MSENIIKEKRKPILIIDKGLRGHGSFTCQFCKKKVKWYNKERHEKSAGHLKKIVAYEKANNCIIIKIDNPSK